MSLHLRSATLFFISIFELFQTITWTSEFIYLQPSFLEMAAIMTTVILQSSVN